MRVLSAFSDNTVFNLRNSSDHAQPHQIIANFLKPYYKTFTHLTAQMISTVILLGTFSLKRDKETREQTVTV